MWAALNRLFNRVRELSLTYGNSTQEILQGAAVFKQAGFSIEESGKLIELGLRAARISELSTAESTALLTSTIKGFVASGEDAERILDIQNNL